MTKRMLIDATHAEETRVVVMDGNRLEDYDVEAANRKQLKGNIYLAKVIRVEPSLQAAFVEYGGNRHGFLAFSEIHPDYYQIPVADREKLLAIQEEEEAAALAAEDDELAADSTDVSADVTTDEADVGLEAESSDESAIDVSGQATPDYVGGETDTGEEALVQKRMARFLRSYKIQEVIRRRQILLVQVVKEERGNKGAALSTYVSLAGRYCVLMPNALRGGGVSRKITSASDRKRLKDIIAELQLPRGMAMIVRTAGAQRPRPEVMKDCEYLLHLWDEIREHTMKSVAPALIYEEASLVKRAIRDVYTRDIDEIVVDGEPGWRSAREFMRMLMPQNAQKVVLWRKEHQPLFSHYQVEGHLDAMLSPTVQLRSGGYLVINQTEALVSIDVNSGRATRERNIEETAVKTNLEAADEVARQLRLRDLAGLIVIDFIDMESRRHNTQVERRLKDALRNDRARIQVGGISHFGLLEMSRQRLRPSVAESAFMPCPHCQGTGIVRGIESSALHVLRAVEEEGAQRRAAEIVVHVAGEIALYILNNKRDWLSGIEARHKMHVAFAADPSLPSPQVRIERLAAQTARFDAPEKTNDRQAIASEARGADEAPERRTAPVTRTIPIGEVAPEAGEDDEAAPTHEARAPSDRPEAEANQRDGSGEQPRRRRRRRRRRGGQQESGASSQTPSGVEPDDSSLDEDEDDGQAAVTEGTDTFGDSGATPENLMPGRVRTRHSRKGRNEERAPQAPVQQAPGHQNSGHQRAAHAAPGGHQAPVSNRAADQRNPTRFEPRQPTRQEPRSAPGWRGPTPADPFGGNFDIFDIMAEDIDAAEAPVPAAAPAPAPVPAQPVTPAVAAVEVEKPDAGSEDATARRPGRRRGGRGAGKPELSESAAPASPTTAEAASTTSAPVAVAEQPVETAPHEAEQAAPPRRGRRKKVAEPVDVAGADEAPVAEEPATKKKPRSPRREPVVVEPVVIGDDAPEGKARTGWWRR